jgi:phosphoglycerol transferase MdoB-like AlkP superfamily enzyme
MKNQFFHVWLLLKRLAIVLLAYVLLQILFYLYNYNTFGMISLREVVHILTGGLRFDITTIIYYNIPFILLHVLPHPWREKKGYQVTLHVLFAVFNYFAIALAVGDIEYFKFNNKRLTIDVLGMGGAFLHLFLQFFKDFWYLFVIYVLLVFAMEWLYHKIKVPSGKLPVNYIIQGITFVSVMALSILGARGGLQTIPITPINATEYASFNKVNLVTNSPYTFIFSLQLRNLEEKKYFDAATCKKYFSTQQKFDKNVKATPGNVVIIMMESFGKEYVGKLNDYKGYTPFLDSLIQVSRVFPNAYANAERSSKATAAIMTGVPSLMDEEIMRSLYQGNCFFGLGTAMKQMGYYTSFYHGGINGEFNLDKFGYMAGFDHYFGRNQFGDEKFFDGHWGIYDEEFFQYFANQLNKQPKPFCSIFFSLSSHHPYSIPEKYKGKFPKGPVEVLESIGYADFSLRRFFETASRMPWFKNTLFIVVADHTFGSHKSLDKKYQNSLGAYAIPFLLYKADGSFSGTDSSVVQQIDIMPTVLEYAGYNKPFTGFGKSVLSPSENKRSFQYLNRVYQIHDKNYILIFDGTKAVGLYDFKTDVAFEHNLAAKYPQIALSFENEIKAIIQTYNHNMIHNKFCNTGE